MPSLLSFFSFINMDAIETWNTAHEIVLDLEGSYAMELSKTKVQCEDSKVLVIHAVDKNRQFFHSYVKTGAGIYPHSYYDKSDQKIVGNGF